MRIYSQVLIFCLLAACLQAQDVDCITYIENPYAAPQECTSTTDDTRPINVTAIVKFLKMTIWQGPGEWTPYLTRNNTLIYNLSALTSCFESQPPKKNFSAGETYVFSVKCVLLPGPLQKGDLVYFRLLQNSHHLTAPLVFLIPIPGYSEPLDEETDAKLKIELEGQSLTQESDPLDEETDAKLKIELEGQSLTQETPINLVA